MRTFFKAIPIGALLAVALAGLSVAADLPKEGTYEYTTCFTRTSTRIDYSPAHFAYSYEESGTTAANPPGGPFDNELVRCVGMTASLDGKRSGGSVCEGTAKDGAKRLARFWYDSEGKFQREAVAGTGKYDGLVTTGSVVTTKQLQETTPGHFEFCNRATGTYKLK